MSKDNAKNNYSSTNYANFNYFFNQKKEKKESQKNAFTSE
jgi:hypothetical protein